MSLVLAGLMLLGVASNARSDGITASEPRTPGVQSVPSYIYAPRGQVYAPWGPYVGRGPVWNSPWNGPYAFRYRTPRRKDRRALRRR